MNCFVNRFMIKLLLLLDLATNANGKIARLIPFTSAVNILDIIFRTSAEKRI